MSSAYSPAHSSRRSVKVRRRGRHTAPSQVERIAGKAAVAAPAVAIAGGVIIGVPATAGAATTAPASAAAGVASHAASTAATTASAARGTTAARTTRATLDAVTSAARTYDVQSGDTLAAIARHFYGDAFDWHYLYQQNTATISDPNLIYPGQVLNVPSSVPATASAQSLAPASDSDTASDAAASVSGGGSSAGATSVASSGSASASASASATASSGYSGALSGTLGCSGLEELWEEAGGSPSEAFTAAEIAMAESGGNQYAVSPTADYGYWQINASHGSMATFNPLGNAEAAVSISSDGSNWDPWTTYTSGAYYGKC